MEKHAPDFKLKGDDGEDHSLGEFKGKYLVLYFYPRDDTPGCTIEAKNFTENVERIRQLNAEVVGISKDSFESHCKFRDKHSLKILLLSDPDNIVIKAYGAYGDRGVFGMGTIRKTFVIDKEGRIIKEYPKVKPQEHVEEVIDYLKSVEN